MLRSRRRSHRRPGKALIALFAATAALAGSAQGLAPAPAAAMIDSNMSEKECNDNFGTWDWFNEVCDVNFGGEGGGSGGGGGGSTGAPLYDGKGSGGGGSTDASQEDAIGQREELAEAEAQAARELMELELKAARAELEGLRSYKRHRCAVLEINEYEIKDQWDGSIQRGFYHGRKADRLQALRQERQELGCGRRR